MIISKLLKPNRTLRSVLSLQHRLLLIVTFVDVPTITVVTKVKTGDDVFKVVDGVIQRSRECGHGEDGVGVGSGSGENRLGRTITHSSWRWRY